MVIRSNDANRRRTQKGPPPQIELSCLPPPSSTDDPILLHLRRRLPRTSKSISRHPHETPQPESSRGSGPSDNQTRTSTLNSSALDFPLPDIPPDVEDNEDAADPSNGRLAFPSLTVTYAALLMKARRRMANSLASFAWCSCQLKQILLNAGQEHSKNVRLPPFPQPQKERAIEQAATTAAYPMRASSSSRVRPAFLQKARGPIALDHASLVPTLCRCPGGLCLLHPHLRSFEEIRT